MIKEMFYDGEIEVEIGIKKAYYEDYLELKVLIDKELVSSSEIKFRNNIVDEE